jgi:hypothetical protein
MQATIEKESPRVVRVQLAGKISAAEWSAALRRVAELLVPGEQMAVLVAADHFEGWEPGNWDDVSFRKHDGDISRMAIVADKKWEDLALMFAGKGLRDIEIEFFTPAEIAKARRWLSESR